MLIAYGATNPEARAALASFERLCRDRFPALSIRWAFSSDLMRERLARQRHKSDSTAKALLRFHFERFAAVAIQPLQVIPGQEYEIAANAVKEIERQCGLKCAFGAPLMTDESEAVRLAQNLGAFLPAQRQMDEDVVLMAHGAKHESGALYSVLAEKLAMDFPGARLAAMSSAPALEDILASLSSPRVWLLPLLSVAGGHALRDMAGPGPGSWKSRIERTGRRCVPVLRGLSECPTVASIWLRNLEDALTSLEQRA